MLNSIFQPKPSEEDKKEEASEIKSPVKNWQRALSLAIKIDSQKEEL